MSTNDECLHLPLLSSLSLLKLVKYFTVEIQMWPLCGYIFFYLFPLCNKKKMTTKIRIHGTEK